MRLTKTLPSLQCVKAASFLLAYSLISVWALESLCDVVSQDSASKNLSGYASVPTISKPSRLFSHCFVTGPKTVSSSAGEPSRQQISNMLGQMTPINPSSIEVACESHFPDAEGGIINNTNISSTSEGVVGVETTTVLLEPPDSMIAHLIIACSITYGNAVLASPTVTPVIPSGNNTTTYEGAARTEDKKTLLRLSTGCIIVYLWAQIVFFPEDCSHWCFWISR